MNYSLKIKELLLNTGADLKGVTEGTKLLEEGIIDSLIVSQLLMEMEDTFQCQFDLDEISPDNFESIGAISDLIKKKLEK